jgi:hypothetical protein
MKKEAAVMSLEASLSEERPEPLSLESLIETQQDLSKAPRRQGFKLDGVVIGTLAGFDDSARPQVVFPGTAPDAPLTALSTVALEQKELGRSVVLQFEGGDRNKPVILGLLQQPLTSETAGEKQIDVTLDGERLVLTADKEIVLRCGKASITLTRAGKVLIRGAYLLNRSSGVNRIKGGSVQIN